MSGYPGGLDRSDSRRLALLSEALATRKSAKTSVASRDDPHRPAAASTKAPALHAELLNDAVRAWEALALDTTACGHGDGGKREEISSAGCPIPPNLLGRFECTLSQLRWPVSSRVYHRLDAALCSPQVLTRLMHCRAAGKKSTPGAVLRAVSCAIVECELRSVRRPPVRSTSLLRLQYTQQCALVCDTHVCMRALCLRQESLRRADGLGSASISILCYSGHEELRSVASY